MRIFACAAAIALAATSLRAEWPQFRGPDGLGTAAGRNLPLTWSETTNVRWKTAIHGRAWSSPVVLDNQVWVSTATPDGRRLSAIAVDRETGRVLHDLELFRVEHPQYARSRLAQVTPRKNYSKAAATAAVSS